jgi:hypothetical protein
MRPSKTPKEILLELLKEKQAVNTDKIGTLGNVKVAFHAAHFYSSLPVSPKCFLLSNNEPFKTQVRAKLRKLQ